MNRSKIEWCDHTWNPITGCRHGCTYCYARTMTARFAGDVRLNKMAKADYQLVDAKDGTAPVYYLEEPMINETGSPLVYPFGFEPTYHRYRMNTLDKLKMGNNIFVGAMSDVFGSWVPDEWVKDVINGCIARPHHNYMFLTKNPERYVELFEAGMLPAESFMWYGASTTNAAQLERATKAFSKLPEECKRFYSIEPILEDVASTEIWEEALRQVSWIIIGAQTGRGTKLVPEKEWIQKIVDSSYFAFDCMPLAPVFMKDSLVQIVGEENMITAFPEELQTKNLSRKMQKKLYSECNGCKKYLMKSDMVTLMARFIRGESAIKYAFMCYDCFKRHCKGLGVAAPGKTEEK